MHFVERNALLPCPGLGPLGQALLRQVCGLAGDDLAAVYEVVRPLPAVECRPLGVRPD